VKRVNTKVFEGLLKSRMRIVLPSLRKCILMKHHHGVEEAWMKGIKSKVRSSAVERVGNMYKLTRIIMQHVPRPSSRMQNAPLA